jgi:hypothetical protein
MSLERTSWKLLAYKDHKHLANSVIHSLELYLLKNRKTNKNTNHSNSLESESIANSNHYDYLDVVVNVNSVMDYG